MSDVILRLDGMVKRFGSVTAVDHLTLDLREGEFLTLLGPSGCGKTTALRVVAGFERADGGQLIFRNQKVNDWSPQRRGFGMVFQNYALFPHLNVSENVSFGLQTRARPRDEIARRVDRALERVSLSGLGSRAVQALSGGQQQRVALARALAIEPPLLLLDEPFSNLDAALRERTRTELRLLVKELGISALFVTHDQEEAFDLSDRIAVMEGGQVRQVGTPEELYRSPRHRFVADFVGRTNTFAGEVELEGGAPVFHLREGERWGLPAGSLGQEGPVELRIRPEDLAFTDPEAPHALKGRILDRRFLGAYTRYFVESNSAGILEVVWTGPGPQDGEIVGLLPSSQAALHLFPAQEEGA